MAVKPKLVCALAASLMISVTLAAEPGSLIDAVKKQDRAAVRALLAQRVNVNVSQVDGTTALHWAAYVDDAETAKLLVEAGAKVKAENRYGVAPLSLACMNGSNAIVELLLASGADPNTTSRGGGRRSGRGGCRLPHAA